MTVMNLWLDQSPTFLRMDILIWVIMVPVALVLLALLIYQLRAYRRLRQELSQLSQIKRHDIEHELVLKAMRLTTWRYDVQAAAITIESDYRQENDNIELAQCSKMDDVYRFMVPEYAEEYKNVVSDLMEGRKEDIHIQYQMKSPNSDKVYWAETFATVDRRDINGRPLVVVGTTRRIDEQKEIERELIEARNHAEESDRLKSAFLANITHEVRTPLNAIVGFSDILPMAQSEEERNELIKLIKQNNAHLLRLFDDMMNMSRLEAGGGSVAKTDFDVHQLLQELADRYLPLCTEKGVELLLDEGHEIIHTDYDRLKEIINQYVNNAVKFTSAGNIRLGCEKKTDCIRVWVNDTGKGIPEDKCNEHLFERFVKVDEFVEGTGLGLSICRSLATSIDGKVGVSSTLGKGSLFWVDVPL